MVISSSTSIWSIVHFPAKEDEFFTWSRSLCLIHVVLHLLRGKWFSFLCGMLQVFRLYHCFVFSSQFFLNFNWQSYEFWISDALVSIKVLACFVLWWPCIPHFFSYSKHVIKSPIVSKIGWIFHLKQFALPWFSHLCLYLFAWYIWIPMNIT